MTRSMQLSVGSVRSKNAKNIVLKNLLDACFGAVCFYLVGYGFAYGGNRGNTFIGYGPFGLRGEARSAFFSWFFQFAVCSHFLSVPCSMRSCCMERRLLQALSGSAALLLLCRQES